MGMFTFCTGMCLHFRNQEKQCHAANVKFIVAMHEKGLISVLQTKPSILTKKLTTDFDKKFSSYERIAILF